MPHSGILAAILFCVAPLAMADRARIPIAANFDGTMLHHVEDVLSVVDPTGEAAAERAALVEGADIRTRDMIDFKHAAWIGDYAFVGPRLRVVSTLHVFPADGLARNTLAEAERGARAGIEENAQRLDAIGRPRAAGRDGSYHLIRSPDGRPVGNVMFVRDGRRWSKLLIVGLYFDDVAEIEAFLEPRLRRALSFEPDFGGKTPIEAGTEPLRRLLSSFTLPLFLCMLIAYWVARGVTAFANRRWPSRARSGRVSGVVLVAVLACVAIAVAHWMLVFEFAEMFRLLPPEQQGRLSGAAIATGLLPALFVLVPVGIATSLRRKVEVHQRPMG